MLLLLMLRKNLILWRLGIGQDVIRRRGFDDGLLRGSNSAITY